MLAQFEIEIALKTNCKKREKKVLGLKRIGVNEKLIITHTHPQAVNSK